MHSAFLARVLRKYDVQYYCCATCGLLRTEKPYWLDEAYQSPIAAADTGLIGRNLANQSLLEPFLHEVFNGNGRFLDVSGGYGLLTRLMRDIGFDCYTTDPYCENLFAKGFEPGEGFKADALFAFEVLEHTPDPLRFLTDTFGRYGCRTLVFSTETYRGEVPAQDWWYYGFSAGQHITFYQPRTLERLAAKLGMTYLALGPSAHLFTGQPLSATSRLLLRSPLRRLYGRFVRLKRRQLSLTWDDHLAAVKAAND